VLAFAVSQHTPEIRVLLVGIAPADLPSFAATGDVAFMAIVGTLSPTIRALRVDPIRAIRAE
jgi:hypothetical protein